MHYYANKYFTNYFSTACVKLKYKYVFHGSVNTVGTFQRNKSGEDVAFCYLSDRVMLLAYVKMPVSLEFSRPVSTALVYICFLLCDHRK